jgi:FemAB-related protein (PEP-CTERM system-associated)
MIRLMTESPVHDLAIWTHTATTLASRLRAMTRFIFDRGPTALSRHPAWLGVLKEGLGHEVYALEARINGEVCGFLPLAFVNTPLFGRFLVSLPYLNSNGVIADAGDVQSLLITRAVELADELGAKHLELRHEEAISHPQLTAAMTSKVHLRLPLPNNPEAFWKALDPKVRNQVRKGEKNDLRVTWGGHELLDPFYDVLCHNMRDLGTPVYGRSLFQAILNAFPGHAELCVVMMGVQPIACALLLHGPGVTEVPTASSLREFNTTCANMLMYRHLIDRAIGRGQSVFDFGRSTADGPTFKFKRQWGAAAHPAVWQYHVRGGQIGEMRPDNPRYQRMIQLWQKLPVSLTRMIGPAIVRGIP